MAEVVAAELKAERQRRIAEILETAGDPRSGPVPPRKPRRDRHGMHIVRGAVPVAAAGAFLRAHARHAAAAAALAVIGTAGALSPDLMQPAPAAQVPARHAARHHHGSAPVTPPAAVPRRKRRRTGTAAVHGSAPPRPSPGASAAPSPSPGPDPTAAPVPSVTPAPLPTLPLPSPTCPDLTGHHCHAPGDLVEGVTGKALRGLTGSL